MIRTQKIEALADAYADNICVRNSQEFRDTFNDYKNGILAGIALVAEELGEFDAKNADDHSYYFDDRGAQYSFYRGAEWQHEEIVKRVKGGANGQE